MFKKAMTALALSAAIASAHSEVLINEGFDNISTLASAGWILNNASNPVGTAGWGQGGSNVFAAHAGDAESFISGNFNNAAAGGQLSNWLITPTFSNATALQLSFYARAADEIGFSELISFGASTGGSNIADFSMGSVVTVPSGDWTKYTITFAAHGAGSVARFAINYTGAADASNFVGVDTLSVNAVPEPSSWLMLAAGLGGLGLLRKRKAAR
ncbi:choice-of-anchor J family PEP-CTERM protein [Roseateles sp. PN1]|uniref:choice-of-anchor J family PEP-CTERM protein n=1 Tax=Roseateles sp. PN1 TaxID=3137372 RepID=UPI003138A3F3